MKQQRITKEMILSVIRKKEYVRVSDIASRLYISKQKARRCLNQLVIKGVLEIKKYKYVGNADICIYKII